MDIICSSVWNLLRSAIIMVVQLTACLSFADYFSSIPTTLDLYLSGKMNLQRYGIALGSEGEKKSMFSDSDRALTRLSSGISGQWL